MRKRIQVPHDYQGWLPVEPDALYLTLARLIARAKNLVQRTHTDLSPFDRAQISVASVRRSKRSVERRR